MSRRGRTIIGLTIGLVLVTVIAIASLVALDDPISRNLRQRTEVFVNQTIQTLAHRGQAGTLGYLDKSLLHASVLSAIVISRVEYPEASTLLWHYVYGDGSTLELDADYFSQSPYLRKKISKLGIGQHGPIALRQEQDWRLSLALNPYYLRITQNSVRLFHPRIEFATPQSKQPVTTVVPIGRLRLRDSLVRALNPTPFEVFAQWPRHPG